MARYKSVYLLTYLLRVRGRAKTFFLVAIFTYILVLYFTAEAEPACRNNPEKNWVRVRVTLTLKTQQCIHTSTLLLNLSTEIIPGKTRRHRLSHSLKTQYHNSIYICCTATSVILHPAVSTEGMHFCRIYPAPKGLLFILYFINYSLSINIKYHQIVTPLYIYIYYIIL
jgi:hypothetical protein